MLRSVFKSILLFPMFSPIASFHANSKFKNGYNFDMLRKFDSNLNKFIIKNKFGYDTIDFSNPNAVKILNSCLLRFNYRLKYWDIPDNFLCPPVPSRADYIYHLNDLIPHQSDKKDRYYKGLDIGVGANCIYPIIGVSEYGWKFVGTDTNNASCNCARVIVDRNDILRDNIEIRLQSNENSIFKSILKDNETFDFCMTNPPFHSSAEEAKEGSRRKWRNLTLNKQKRSSPIPKVTKSKSLILNFGGEDSELHCDGGEVQFISNMIDESCHIDVQSRIRLFTSLVSKQSSLIRLTNKLEQISSIKDVQVISCRHGNKDSSILIWRF